VFSVIMLLVHYKTLNVFFFKVLSTVHPLHPHKITLFDART